MPQSIAELFDLSRKVALVTGAGTGIGEAVASRLAEAGAGVLVVDINLEAAERVAGQIRDSGGLARPFQGDVSSVGNAGSMCTAALEALGSLDILVNNAAVFPFSPALEMKEETWDRVLDVNLKGIFFCSQAAARVMIEAGRGGKIINLASMDGIHPTRVDTAHYNASKGGVIMLTKALALDFARYNIQVNSVAPGAIITRGSMAQAAAVQARGEPLEELWKNFVARMPLGRFGEPDDIAKVVLFLASGAADYLTGTIILADGGYLLS
ncbi:MAG: SDR family oxidoreductase [Dehalococcoidia bacterium]|nr:SDR family oxidoreductase [Dehalococcoidia bacterium]